ncbi:MAG: hypothetical protein EAZ20_03225 [Bacteroidetes bacterium]|nr:MAG: hypothetical protein EAZ20_03225 [Bacteroidota bacterium]
MSLKVEQRLLNQQFTEFEPKIYATGVYLVPMKVNLNGIEKWIWVAEEFESDSYYNGNSVSVSLISDDLESMIIEN